MADYAAPGAGDFEAIARQYWNLWSDALRQAGGAPAAPANSWQQALDWWSRLIPGGNGPVEDVLQRFRQQSGDWYGQMQQLAARFAGQEAAAGDIAQAWRQALGGTAGTPLMDFFRSLQGSGSGGFDGWYRQVAPWLDNLRREHERWLHLPAFGPAREHQERWQALAQSVQDYQRCLGDYERVMLHVAQLAFARFESLLERHAEPGRQIGSARALFDLWIDAAEQAYGEVALSPEFRHVYGALTNAQMRLRLGVKGEVEQFCQALGMPTRTEVDSAHRKIAELERRLRRLDKAAEAAEAEHRGTRRAPSAREDEPAAPPAPAVRKTARKTPAKAAAKPAAKTAPPAVPKRAAAAKPRRAKAAAKPRKAKTTASRAAPVAGKTKKARSVAAAAPAAARKRGQAVVSMKDWVARARRADEAPTAAGQAKRKRGQGDRK